MRALLLAIFVFESVLPLNAQSKEPADAKEIENVIDPVFARQLNDRNYEAAAVVVVKGNEVLLAKGFGSDSATHLPVDPYETIFRAASVSKLFVATAVLQLAERGELRLDEDINRYLKRFQLLPRQSPPVTAAGLLTHTSGIENWFLGSLVRSPSDLVPLGDYFARHKPRTFRVPGTELTYSNQGMALAGYLVEVISHESFQNYAERRILKPLAMDHSTFRQTRGPAFEPYPAATLTSTVADMGQFLRMQLNHGQVGNQLVLRPETIADMQRQHWTAHVDMPGVAYGFFESYWNGERVLFHTGDSGDHSLLLLLPQRGWGCYAVYRGGERATEKVREDLTTALMDHYYPAAPFVLPRPTVRSAELDKFAGLYRASSVNPYTIEKVLGISRQVHIRPRPDGSLELSELGVRAIAIEPGLFRTDGGGYLSFRTAPNGRIVGGTITGSIWDPQSFDRIQWWEDGSLHRALLALSLLILFSRLIVGLLAVIRRKRAEMSPAANTAQLSIAVLGWRLSGLLPLIVLVGVLCFIANLLVWRPPITGVPPGGLALLVSLTIASGIGATLPLFAVFAWTKGTFGIERRIYFSFLALAGALFAAILFYWNVSAFRV